MHTIHMFIGVCLMLHRTSDWLEKAYKSMPLKPRSGRR